MAKKSAPVPPAIDKKAKLKIWIGILVVGFISIAALFSFIGNKSKEMIVHMNDRPAAIGQFIKDCGAEAQSQGLKNADAMKYSDQCVSKKVAEMDAKKK
jgi:hypothetical protein